MKLDLFSEMVSAYGGMTGTGAKKILGAPEINPFGVVVREAVQNSWDAQASDDPVIFGIKGYELDVAQRRALGQALKDGATGNSPIISLPQADEPVDGLVLFDRGTSGLGGPVRPNLPGPGDFARFVYLVGATKSQMTKISTGGTYGFGRSAFLNASSIGTILIHTHCRNETDVVEARFIGMTWGHSDSRDALTRTGRHWWGRKGRDGWVGPLIGEDADEMAVSLGMPVPPARALGTTILVTLPRWAAASENDERSTPLEDIPSALTVIRDSALWYAWPRISSGELKLDLDWFGTTIPFVAPSEHPQLKLFVQALGLAEGTASPGLLSKRVDIHCKAPKRRLGALGLVKGFHSPGPAGSSGLLNPDQPLHHVALMRDTRLVVEYLPCAMPIEGSEYAGVFVTDDDVDAVFAASEPPSHDKWVKEQVTKGDRTLVSVTLREIPRAAKEFALPPVPDQTVQGGNLAAVSELLGGLLLGTDGGGVSGWQRPPGGRLPPKTPTKKPGGGNKGGRPLSAEAGTPSRRIDGGRLLLDIPVNVSPGERAATLEAGVDVVVDGGGAEGAPPEGAPVPEVVGWTVGSAGEQRKVEGASLRVTWEGSVPVILTISQPRDCSLRIRLSVDT